MTTTLLERARDNMVESQLRTNKVYDEALLAALREVPRELFVPAEMASVAYMDRDLPLGAGRYLLEPRVMARLLQEAEVTEDDVVLVVGCGTGYAAALLERMAATVVALESDAGLVAKATEILDSLDENNAVVVTGPLAEGHAKEGPYTVILVVGAVSEIPKSLTDQLAEGGRLVTVVKQPGAVGRATIATRSGTTVSARSLFDAATPVLPEFERKPGFVFA